MSDYKARRYANSVTERGFSEVLRNQLPFAVLKVPTDDWIAVAYSRKHAEWKPHTAAKACVLWKHAKDKYTKLFFLSLFFDSDDFESFWEGVEKRTHKIIDIAAMEDKVPPLHEASKKYRSGGEKRAAGKNEPTEWDHSYAQMVFRDRGWCTFDEYMNAIRAAQGDRTISLLSRSGIYQVLPPDNEFEYGFNIRINPKGKK